VNELIQALRQFLDVFRLWVIVQPWEQVMRVRLGTEVQLLEPGLHWRFSPIDSVFTQSVRLRVSQVGRATVMSKDQRPITYAASLGYSIKNIQKLYTGLHHAEDTLQNLARAEIARYISEHDSAQLERGSLESVVESRLSFEQYGLSEARVYITEFMNVRTYRLIGDTWYGTQGAALNVEATK